MRDFGSIKRIVIKVGTNILSKQDGIDTDFIQNLAKQICEVVGQGKQVILVTSGAIGMGAKTLNIQKAISEVKLRQACAAVGQGLLIREYQDAFAKYHQIVGQVLLTNRNMSYRRSYVNLKNTIETLLNRSVVPIINENDSVAIDEIDLAFGDNDKLSALVASKIDAELLIILTDVEGFYNADPRENPDARLLPVVYEITPEIESMAGSAGSKFGRGGMKSKIEAIKIASHAGCQVILAHGRKHQVINQILAGKEIGTLCLPLRRLSNRKRWILNATAKGHIQIDQGASNSLRQRKSLLPVGITKVEGNFEAGEIVTIGKIAKGVVDYSSEQLRQVLEAQRFSFKKNKKSRAVVHGNNIVLLDFAISK
jgi:glutamate 5-kinase